MPDDIYEYVMAAGDPHVTIKRDGEVVGWMRPDGQMVTPVSGNETRAMLAVALKPKPKTET